MRRISGFEHRARKFVLKKLAPRGLRLLERAGRMAETRVRRSFAIQRHVSGAGIEVGAGPAPAIVPLGCKVYYVDKYDANVLRADPELRGISIADPDLKDTAEELVSIASDSQDFVLAFSLLEHVEDVLGTLKNFHRVTKSGGAIVVSVPDKRYYGPDRARPITPFEHFVRDHVEGPASSRADHFREVAELTLGLSAPDVARFVANSIENDASTHFHVWDAETFLNFLMQAKSVLRIQYEVAEFASYGHESLAVLRVAKSVDQQY